MSLTPGRLIVLLEDVILARVSDLGLDGVHPAQ
jgi:hypothetical protein